MLKYFMCSVNNSFKKKEITDTPWTKDCLSGFYNGSFVLGGNFSCHYVCVQSSIKNFKTPLIFIYWNPSMQHDRVSLERKPWPPGVRGKKKQQCKCWEVEREWTFPELVVGQSSCAELWHGSTTYVPQLDRTLLESNQRRGLRVGARWRPG